MRLKHSFKTSAGPIQTWGVKYMGNMGCDFKEGNMGCEK